MRCPHCDADTPTGAKSCTECGDPLKPRCPRCGADTLPRARFCGECGTSLAAQPPATLPAHPASPLRHTPGHLAQKILTSKAALEGERKQVTVLFADLKGSMALLADRDPEDARQLLDPVLTLMTDGVHRYEWVGCITRSAAILVPWRSSDGILRGADAIRMLAATPQAT
jgi:Double zinc ribbon